MTTTEKTTMANEWCKSHPVYVVSGHCSHCARVAQAFCQFIDAAMTAAWKSYLVSRR